MLHADESVCKILIRQQTTCCRQMNLCAQNKEAGEQEIDKKKAIVCAATGELLTKLTGRRTHRSRSQIIGRVGDAEEEGIERTQRQRNRFWRVVAVRTKHPRACLS